MTPRHTEVIARETLTGLMRDAMDLMESDYAAAWGKLILVYMECLDVAKRTETELHLRHHRNGVPV
jgi:hypothetical protein